MYSNVPSHCTAFKYFYGGSWRRIAASFSSFTNIPAPSILFDSFALFQNSDNSFNKQHLTTYTSKKCKGI